MDCIRSYIENNFSEKRKQHTYGVCKTAKELAAHYGADVEKAEIAALFHDFFRGVKEEALNVYVRQLGLPEKYMNNCNLAHGKIAAIVMKRDYGIEDQDIINAVAFHTTGREGMSDLEKIVYLADAIEPGRDYPGVSRLRDIAFEGLDYACLASLSQTIDFIVNKGVLLDEDTLKARDYLAHSLKKKEKINEY